MQKEQPENSEEVESNRGKGPGGRPFSRRSLNNLSDIKRAVSYTCRCMEAGGMDDKIGRALIYGYATLAEMMKDTTMAELLRRLEELERAQHPSNGNGHSGALGPLGSQPAGISSIGQA